MGKKNQLTRLSMERILWLDIRMRAERFPKAEDLCEQFDIRPRTAYRDVEYLRNRLGGPVAYDRIRQGYFYTDKNYRLPRILMTEGELLALFLAEKVLRQHTGMPHAAALHSAFQKICRALPEEVTVDLGMFDQGMTFEANPARPVDEETFRKVERALRERSRIGMRYHSVSRDEETTRKADPYHLHNYEGDWYLIAYDHLRGAMRDFALSRIRALEILEEFFTLRPEFDRQSYLSQHFGGYQGDRPVEVLVRFDPYQSRWMREREWPCETARWEGEDSSLTLRLTVTSLEGVLRWVMRYGSHAEVLEPEELRERVRAEVKGMVGRYGDDKQHRSRVADKDRR